MMAWSKPTSSSEPPRRDAQRAAAGEVGPAHDGPHVALAAQQPQPGGQPPHDAVLPFAQGVEVDARLAEVEPEGARLVRLGDHAGGVQQRLGGDAAAVGAGAAGILLLVDQRHVEAAQGGVERGRIAAGPRADDGQPLARGDGRARPSQPSSASISGCRMASVTQVMKRAPSAPSSTRWSKVSESGMCRRGSHDPPSGVAGVVGEAKHLLRPPDAQDGDVRPVDDGREVARAEPSQVRDGEAAAAHLVDREFVVARLGADPASIRPPS